MFASFTCGSSFLGAPRPPYASHSPSENRRAISTGHRTFRKRFRVFRTPKDLALPKCFKFLRPQKSYKPREDSAERIDAICESQAIPVNDDAKLEDPVLRFKLFVACEEELKYSIPNSLLYTIETVGDLKRFYSTPVDNTTPYEALGKIDLPKNLHILQNYHRFHPDTDTMFNGKTAFPKSSTLVTGLKYRKKYPGHTQESPWLDEQMKI
ncbi:uncharacterized protein LOC105202721 isoform X2 [Solenopsis invicta]|uniref:uncharacterized protein LOC105202721 isoform X2 n=1 Tax=Solenopsis invicta TaxID=13686 RepID=UPI000E33D61B|nr:uncharacterized protein LOC105202721 isoform X2 [Solenopsis invicta]